MAGSFEPRVVRVTMENATDEYPFTMIEEGMLFHPDFVISRYEKCVVTGQVTFWVRRVEQYENSVYYNGSQGEALELMFIDSSDLLQDMSHLTFVEFLDKHLPLDRMGSIYIFEIVQKQASEPTTV